MIWDITDKMLDIQNKYGQKTMKCEYQESVNVIKILSIGTDSSEQAVQTRAREIDKCQLVCQFKK